MLSTGKPRHSLSISTTLGTRFNLYPLPPYTVRLGRSVDRRLSLAQRKLNVMHKQMAIESRDIVHFMLELVHLFRLRFWCHVSGWLASASIVSIPNQNCWSSRKCVPMRIEFDTDQWRNDLTPDRKFTGVLSRSLSPFVPVCILLTFLFSIAFHMLVLPITTMFLSPRLLDQCRGETKNARRRCLFLSHVDIEYSCLFFSISIYGLCRLHQCYRRRRKYRMIKNLFQFHWFSTGFFSLVFSISRTTHIEWISIAIAVSISNSICT